MLFKRKDYVKVDGSILVPPNKRWCGAEFKNNEFYLRSAEAEAIRIRDNLGCNKNSHILDVGSGQGRLAIGILRIIGTLNYTGIDIHKPSVQWCRKHIQRKNPSFQFKHLDAYNERYSKNGDVINEGFHFDVTSQSMDIIYLYSVFSHMKKEEMEIYLRENLRMITSMDVELCSMRMDGRMKENGLKANFMGMEKWSIQMETDTEENGGKTSVTAEG